MKLKYLFATSVMLVGLTLIATGITGGRMTLAQASDIYHGKKSISDVLFPTFQKEPLTYIEDPTFSGTTQHCEKANAILNFIARELVNLTSNTPIREQFAIKNLSQEEISFLSGYYKIKTNKKRQSSYLEIVELSENCQQHIVKLGSSFYHLIKGQNKLNFNSHTYTAPSLDQAKRVGYARFKFLFNEKEELIDYAIRSRDQMIQGLREEI